MPGSGVIEEWNAADPVTVFCLSLTFKIILPAGIIPHKITEPKPVHLVTHKEAQIVSGRGFRAFRYIKVISVKSNMCGIGSIPYSREKTLLVRVIFITHFMSGSSVVMFFFIFIIEHFTLVDTNDFTVKIRTLKQR